MSLQHKGIIQPGKVIMPGAPRPQLMLGCQSALELERELLYRDSLLILSLHNSFLYVSMYLG